MKNEINRCSAVVVYINNGEEKRQSLCSIMQAMAYVEDCVLRNGYKFISIERGFDY